MEADASNDGNLYNFEHGGEEPGAAEGRMGGDAVDERLRVALAAVLPRGMTSTKHFVELAVKAGGGSCAEKEAMAVVVLGKFCAEGDNRMDGWQLGDAVLKHLLSNV